MKRILSLLILTFPMLVFTSAYAQEKEPEIGIVEHLNDYLPDGILVTTDKGETVDIKTLIDKPTGLSLVYFRCPGICTPLMNGMAEVSGKSEMIMGDEYQYVTVSFDHTEGIDVAKRKKKNYINMIEKEVNPDGWVFCVADSANVAKLTNALGFKYKKVGNEYTHTASLMVLSPDAKITRYLNGTYFLPFDLKMSMIEASKGKAMPTRNKVLQFCYSYDIEGNRYVLNVTKVSGVIILFFAVVLLSFLIFRPRRKKIEINQ